MTKLQNDYNLKIMNILFNFKALWPTMAVPVFNKRFFEKSEAELEKII